MAKQNSGNLATSDSQIKGRFDSIDDQIGHFINPPKRGDPAPRPRADPARAIDIAKKVLVNLQAFVERQHEYFNNSAILPEGFSKEYALNLIVDQAESDVEVIERVISQRSLTALLGGIDVLEVADSLVQAALTPAESAGLFPKDRPPVALTYFQKLASIRLVPYANVALIGIPYSCLNNPADLFAIPHEAGHYIFWHGIIPETAVSPYKGIQLGQALIEEAKRRNINGIVLPWVEEIFSDAYAAIVAGALQARNLQDLINGRTFWRKLDKSPEATLEVVKGDSLIYDDGDHPLPALRPFIHSEMLRRTGNVPWAVQLESRWAGKLFRKVDLRDGTFANDNTTRICEAHDALIGLVRLIDDMLRTLESQGELTSTLVAEAKKGWWYEPTTRVRPPLKANGKDATDRLYEAFALAHKKPPAVTRPVENVPALDYDQWLEDLRKRDDALYVALGIKPAGADRPTTRDWFLVLGSGGWTDGPDGPQGSGGGGGI